MLSEPQAATPAYFHRLSPTEYAPTEHVGGAWDTREQHIAPAIGLLVHAIESDHAVRHERPLKLARLSCDILGTLPVEPFTITLSVLRPGRTIELMEARLTHGGRDAVVARAWLMQGYDSSAVAGSPLPSIPGPGELAEWDPKEVWPGGMIRSITVRRAQVEPGRARFWVRSGVALLGGEPVSGLASSLRLADVANGMTVRESIDEVAFPNVDITAHVFREPAGEWVGYDTAVTFGSGGLGVTNTVLHDEAGGPFATLAQSLTVRPT